MNKDEYITNTII